MKAHARCHLWPRSPLAAGHIPLPLAECTPPLRPSPRLLAASQPLTQLVIKEYGLDEGDPGLMEMDNEFTNTRSSMRLWVPHVALLPHLAKLVVHVAWPALPTPLIPNVPPDEPQLYFEYGLSRLSCLTELELVPSKLSSATNYGGCHQVHRRLPAWGMPFLSCVDVPSLLHPPRRFVVEKATPVVSHFLHGDDLSLVTHIMQVLNRLDVTCTARLMSLRALTLMGLEPDPDHRLMLRELSALTALSQLHIGVEGRRHTAYTTAPMQMPELRRLRLKGIDLAHPAGERTYLHYLTARVDNICCAQALAAGAGGAARQMSAAHTSGARMRVLGWCKCAYALACSLTTAGYCCNSTSTLLPRPFGTVAWTPAEMPGSAFRSFDSEDRLPWQHLTSLHARLLATPVRAGSRGCSLCTALHCTHVLCCAASTLVARYSMAACCPPRPGQGTAL